MGRSARLGDPSGPFTRRPHPASGGSTCERLRRRAAEGESEDDRHQQQQTEVVVHPAVSGSREGKVSRRNRRRSEKKAPRGIELEKSDKEEEERLMDEEEGELWGWLSRCRYWSHYLTLRFGSCDGDITSVPPMCYTKGPIPAYAITDHALQIFSVQVMEVKDDLEWPLHVYGWVATRYSVDPKRNHLFNRTRDNCQVLTQQIY